MDNINVSILQRGASSWRLRTRVQIAGVWSEETETVRGTRQQAEARKALIIGEFTRGDRLQLSLDTVAAHVTGWISYRQLTGAIRESTARNYKIMLRPFLAELGHIRLTSLSVDQCRLFVAKDATDGVKNAKQRFIIAKAALASAVKEGKITTNPYSRFDPPRVPSEGKKTTIDGDQLKTLYAASWDAGKTGLAIRIAISTGLRRGELAALRWRDIERGILHVRQNAVRGEGAGITYGPPKTAASIRSISIPAYLSEELEQLRGADDDLLLDGVHPETLAYRVNAHLPKGFTIHALRHAHATALLSARIPVKVVSERLGHSDITMTLRVYQHVLPKDEAAAIDAINAVVGTSCTRVVA